MKHCALLFTDQMVYTNHSITSLDTSTSSAHSLLYIHIHMISRGSFRQLYEDWKTIQVTRTDNEIISILYATYAELTAKGMTAQALLVNPQTIYNSPTIDIIDQLT